MDDTAPIFISYRRSDAAGHARALHEYLSGRFRDDRIFFDRSTIEGGDIFTETIREGVEGCAVLLALIGPDWLDVKSADGNRRLENPADIVRQEIALALERSKKVIPVLFDDTPVPPADRLPEPLKKLASCDALTLVGKTYEYRTQRRALVRLLAKVPGVPAPFAEAGEAITGSAAAELPAIIAAATRGWEQLSAEQQKTIDALKEQLGANTTQLAAFFQIIGEAQVPPEQQPARLVEIAAQVRQLRAQVASEPGDAPEMARLKDAARAALDAGRLEEADDLLAQVEAEQDAVLGRQQMERAAIAAQRGGIALTRLRYREAAQHFAAAAQRLPPGRDEQALAYLDQEADALYRHGEEFGDNAALVDAITRYGALVHERPRERVPLQWAMTQNNLGDALRALGARESDTAHLEEAVAAYREALEERTPDRLPLEWAATKTNLGLALTRLGERESGTARLEEAVATFREALKEQTRERAPLNWAMTQNSLGLALWRLGERESGTARLEEAVATFREALKERTRERVPLDWAITQNSLGLTLWRLGERESGTARLEEAVAAFREALKEQTRERVPLDWAMTQNNLGLALGRLGARESNTAHLEEAVASYREALKERTRERVPLDWALTQNNLCCALRALGQRGSGTERLEDAVAVCREALRESTRERVPLQWAMTQDSLGSALRVLGQREGGTERLEEAVEAYCEALKEYTRERVPLEWAWIQNNLGNALALLGERARDALKVEEARDAISAASEIVMQSGQEHRRAYFEDRLREIDRQIDDLSQDPGASLSPGLACQLRRS